MELIGRAEAVAQLGEAVRRAPLVTVWGPPGVGKTALAQQVLSGAVTCSLVSASGVDAVCWAVATALGLTPDTDLCSTVRRSLQMTTRPVLLDGADDARAALDELLPEWLEDGEGPRFVVTARRALDAGENLELRPLDTSDAVALLAQAGCQGHELAPAIVERLDRLPLAIEWFASRAALLGVEVAWERLCAFAEREDPLEAPLAESIAALSTPERELLSLVSAFETGAPTKLLADLDVAALEALVGAALVRVERERVRPYRAVIKCMRKLADDEGRWASLTRRHAEAVLSASEPRAIELEVIASRFVDEDPALAQRALLASCPLALHDGSAARMVDRLTSLDTEPTPAALLWLGRLQRRLGRFADARLVLERAAAAGEAFPATIELAHLDRQVSKSGDALAGYRRALELAADPSEEAIGLGEIGRMLQSLGRFGEAQRHHEKAIALSHRSGLRDREDLERSLHARAIHRAGRVREAIALHEDALARHDAEGRRRLVAAEKGHLGFCHHEIGEHATAERRFRESIAGLAAVGDVVLECIERTLLARLFVDLDRHAEARLELAIAEAAIAPLGMPRLELTHRFVLGLSELARGEEEAARVCWAGALELGVALEVGFEALLPAHAGWLEAKRGDEAVASRYFEAAEEAVADVDSPGARLALDVLRASAFGQAMPVIDEDVRSSSSDVRRAWRLARPAESRPLRVASDGRQAVLPNDMLVELGRRAAPKRLLLGLVTARIEEPGVVRTFDELIEVGWPGERMQADAARKRLRTAIWTLRKMGLDEMILTSEDGYLLDPLVPVEWSR